MRIRDWLGVAAVIAMIVAFTVATALWGNHTVGVSVCIGRCTP